MRSTDAPLLSRFPHPSRRQRVGAPAYIVGERRHVSPDAETGQACWPQRCARDEELWGKSSLPTNAAFSTPGQVRRREGVGAVGDVAC